MRINLGMTLRIMGLNMCKLRRILERRNIPIKMSHPFMDIWISGSDIPDIGLEVLHVDGIEAHDCREEADVGFSDRGAEIVGAKGGGEV